MPKGNSSREHGPFSNLLGYVLSIGLMVAMAFTALAHGAVEPWSVTTLGLILIFLFSIWIIKAVVDRTLTIQIPATFYPLVALLGLGCFQSFSFKGVSGSQVALSLDVEATRLAIEVIIYMILALLIAANYLTDQRKLGWFRNFIICFGFGLAVFGLVQHFTWNGKYFWVIEPTTAPSFPFGPFVNHNHFAGYMEMIAPIPIGLILLRAVRGELWLFYGFTAVMMSVATAVSLSRGGMVSLFAGVLFVISLGLRPESMASRGFDSVEYGRWKLPMMLSRYGAALAIVLTISVGIWWIGADPVLRRMEKGELSLAAGSKEQGKETFFQSRGWIWRDTMEMIRANWLTGVGLGAYHTAYPIYTRQDGLIIVSQAHNDYLQALADGGIVGALIVLWFLVLIARDTTRAIRHRDPMKAGTALGCAGGIFALAVHSIFDFNLQLPSNALLFLVLSAVVSRIAAGAVEGRVNQTFLEKNFKLRVAA